MFKESAYLTMARPQLDWVLNDCDRFSLFTVMLDQLPWPTLQTCCKLAI